MTSRVSTRTSRSKVSGTRAAASGAEVVATTGVTVPGSSAVVPAGVVPAGPVVAVVADPPAGFGTGFTNNACHVYSTMNARKMARRTRRSIQQVRLPDTTSGDWDRIVARRTQRMAADKPAGGQPNSAGGAMTVNGLGCVVRARGQKPAGTPKIWRNENLVASNQDQAQSHGRRSVSGLDGGVVR